MTEYTYRAMWSPAAGSYVGTCLEFPGLRQHRETAGEAVEATEQRVSLNQWVVQKLVGRTDSRGF
ncbi:toxin-antitoxin system HicB family antitoxin [Mycolicibacterium neoaurum]|uniref:HicB family protein n=1 Tax=Mycolicibacterium neoaurum TaxID=1795 RepID=A0AAV2WRW7_MYCNE|nr:toxin-antitoxin system HicB family antitoxin [Mycolicibacterium neoaurum]TLH59121.1 toxin-antitoxin system HicB family antitoxin [Mycolicibacterium neoaurum]CDQ47016.1 HicB family protein [Mycolicibacterium neoaurum]